MAIFINSSIPCSNIKKKYCVFINKQSKQNQADVLTKALLLHLLYKIMKTLNFSKH